MCQFPSNTIQTGSFNAVSIFNTLCSQIKQLEQQIKESELGARRLVREARNAKEDLQKFVKKNVREEDRPRHREEKIRPREETRRKEERNREKRQSSQSRSRQSKQSSRHCSESRSRQNSGKESSRKEETIVREEEWVIKAPSKWDVSSERLFLNEILGVFPDILCLFSLRIR